MSAFHAFKELSQLFDLLPNVQFWVKDRESRFQACNTGFAAHFGLSNKQELEGLTDFDVSPHPLAREYVQDDKAILATGKGIVSKMELVKEKDGALKWYATSKIPILDCKHSIVGTAGITHMVKSPLDEVAPSRGINHALAEMNTRFGEDLKIPVLAASAGMSVDNFERKFRGLFRETPLKYLNRIRMRSACGLLLHTEMTVGEISKQVGYSDQSYFAKRFFAHFRIRPLDYRRKYRPKS